jgi:hypothetical protein
MNISTQSPKVLGEAALPGATDLSSVIRTLKAFGLGLTAEAA